MSLEILYQNVGGMRTKINDSALSLTSMDADMVCITETWLNSSFHTAELSLNDNYQIFRRDRSYGLSLTMLGGGCIIAVKKGIDAKRRYDFETNLATLEDIWLEIRLFNSKLYICVTYISPNSDRGVFEEHYDKIKDNITSLDIDSKVILLGDFNLPMITWTAVNGRVIIHE